MGTITRTGDPDRISRAPAFRLIGGKGGVGKTTCAAAMAVTAARSGARTLVISTDPAPSLGDAFGRPLSGSPRRIPLRRGSLYAVEIDARRALTRWLESRREAFERIAVRGTWLDEDDVARLLRLSLPGIDEIAALLEVVRFGRTGRFDLIVVDTAPTGHTLRMLSLPYLLRRVAHLFDQMQEKHRMMVHALRGGWEPDAEDALIDELDRDGRALAALLRDPARVATTWVTLPEPMAVAETADGVAALTAAGITVQQILVNRIVERPDGECRRCRARRAFEQRAAADLARRMPDARVTGIRAREQEPRGVTALAAIGDEIKAGNAATSSSRSTSPRWRADIGPASSSPVIAELADDDTQLLMFGGKGGVGKTTCAVAAALDLAARFPARRVLLLSTDPAHSVGDALGVALSDVPRTIRNAPANLLVRELDATQRFAGMREKYASAIEAVFDRIARGSSFEAGHDRSVMRELIDLAPPGIDELIAVSEVTDALTVGTEGPSFDRVVMDMAPSGHALRLLETPAVVQDWAKVLMSILLKYQPVVGIGELGAMLLRLSREIGRLRELLTDSRRSRFVVVTRGAALPRAETVRLVRRLARMHVHVAAVIVNAAGRGTCGRCRREASAEGREIAALRRAIPARAIPLVIAPAEVPPPHGPDGLREWSARWRRGGGISSKRR